VAGCPAVAPGGRGSAALGFVFSGAGAVWCWSAGCEGVQAGDRGGELGGPGPGAARRSRRRRPPRTMRPAAENSRSRSRLGSQARAGPSRARSCIQAVTSQAIATSSHQIWFWSKPCRGRLRSPVSLAARMRSSQRARWRWRSSRSASWPRRASVAKQVKRCPSISVNRSCAPGGSWASASLPSEP